MGNNECYFFRIKYKLEKHWTQVVLQPCSPPLKLPWFNVLCFSATLWGPWLFPIYAHSGLSRNVGRRSHPYQQWCQCFLLISLGNTHPSPPWPTQQPNLSLQFSFSHFPSFTACSQSVTEPRHHYSTGWLGCAQRKQPWSWQLCVQTQYEPLVCCLISLSLCLSLSLVHWGLKQLSLFFPVSEGYWGWQDTISGFKIGLPFFTAQEVNSSEMAQSCSSFTRRDWAHLKAFIILI